MNTQWEQKVRSDFFGCGLTESEWSEVVTLDYVLTWNYTDNRDADEQRYKKLSDKRWAAIDRFYPNSFTH